MDDKFYTPQDIAKTLKVAYLTVYRWIQSKKLLAIKAGKQYRISKSELDKFVNKHK